MREQYEVEQLVAVDQHDQGVRLDQQANHIRELEEKIARLSQEQSDENGRRDWIKGQVKAGKMDVSQDGSINVIMNQHELPSDNEYSQ